MKTTEKAPNTLSLPFLEGLYADYVRDPQAVSPEWRAYFKGLENGEPPERTVRLGPSFRAFSIFNPPTQEARGPRTEVSREVEQLRLSQLQDRVDQLVRSFRYVGHLIARFNPLDFPRQHPDELNPQYYGLGPADMDKKFSCETMHPEGPLTLAEILDVLWNTYCRSIGVEYMHIDQSYARQWLQERMEQTQNRLQLHKEEQLRIYTKLTDAVLFEQFIRRKFVGTTTFSLEGSESLIPLLDLAIEKAGEQGLQEIVLGMAHRGRLNVLANIMGKSPRQIFREFADRSPKLFAGRGDVKYHLGHSRNWKTAGGKIIHLSLCFNPSHLEYVNAVVLGRTRAKQDRAGDTERRRGMALLIHGDASFAGEGLVQETLNLSQLPGFAVGGTLHVIVNNQIGFTTGPDEGRSTRYASDVAKMLQIPIFHVNGEDPEAVAQVVQLAMDFRQTFNRDVVIDMYGYRRLGHNESDEPAFTQPVLYRAIDKRKPVGEAYLEHLLKLGDLTPEEAQEIAQRRQTLLEKELSEAQSDLNQPQDDFHSVWVNYSGGLEPPGEVETSAPKAQLSEWLTELTRLPENFHPHPKIKRFLKMRQEMAAGKAPLDWSAAEALALASLAAEGFRVRLSGQDAVRGTFSQRHGLLVDYEDGHRFATFENLTPKEKSKLGPVEMVNSPLSEAGVLGFEYGYSLDWPDGLVLWEAQYGDFWNAAQVIVDQFLTSAEDKWGRLSGLVMLLPHGFEGAGPEHSSARLERFLDLAAEDNMKVVYPTTPAQYFHVLRRQVLRPWRKPLIVMTPKSLLRHPKVISSLEDCAQGHWQRVLPDTQAGPLAAIRRVLLCSGKIYYELAQKREELHLNDVAVVRLEQLYPLRVEELRGVLNVYSEGTPAIWVQEEPQNMGAWRFLRLMFGNQLFGRFPFSGLYRPPSASPAAGSASRHRVEQAELIERAFGK